LERKLCVTSDNVKVKVKVKVKVVHWKIRGLEDHLKGVRARM